MGPSSSKPAVYHCLPAYLSLQISLIDYSFCEIHKAVYTTRTAKLKKLFGYCYLDWIARSYQQNSRRRHVMNIAQCENG